MSDAASLAAVLPNYEIAGELGRGGFGVVRAGRHRQLDRAVAIKELPAALANDPGVRARFVTEARVLASLDHPHIVPVYDYVEQDGLCLLVMESLAGGTVWQSFTEHGYTPETACAVVMVTCAGLHYAHGHGVLHRDVKPENLLFTDAGQLKVTDFGIAKVLGGGDALATSAGDILGTPAYMAPEQAEGKELGPPADVYAAGVMLYELLSGRLPFSEEGGGIAIVYRHVAEQPLSLTSVAPQVPKLLADVVMRAIARQPADRYPTAEAFGVAIGEAATQLFGMGWLERADVPVMVAGPILAQAVRSGDSWSGRLDGRAGPARNRRQRPERAAPAWRRPPGRSGRCRRQHDPGGPDGQGRCPRGTPDRGGRDG
jgi:serine/threonine protein kinase